MLEIQCTFIFSLHSFSFGNIYIFYFPIIFQSQHKSIYSFFIFTMLLPFIYIYFYFYIFFYTFILFCYRNLQSCCFIENVNFLMKGFFLLDWKCLLCIVSHILNLINLSLNSTFPLDLIVYTKQFFLFQGNFPVLVFIHGGGFTRWYN